MSDATNAKWLRSLSATSAKRLYDLMMSNARYYSERLVDGVALPGDFNSYIVLDDDVSPLKTGAEWRKYVSCITFDENSLGMDWSAGYPRFQMNWKLNKDGEWQTPLKRSRGELPIMKRVSDVLTDEEWASFRAMYVPDASEKRTSISIKIMCHHIAYNMLAKSQPALYPELPEQLGAGSSVSHLCDNKCITGVHMIVSDQHVQNLERQRCAGVTLLCSGGVILQAIDCPHFKSDDDGVVLAPNCVRLRVVELNFDPFDASKRDAFCIKRAEFELAQFQDSSQPGMSGGGIPFSHA